jgi:hypothetical protein
MTQTTQTTDTVIDRYIRIFDRSAHDPAALDELQSIFAPDATIQLSDEQEPVTGLAAIMEQPVDKSIALGLTAEQLHQRRGSPSRPRCGAGAPTYWTRSAPGWPL